MTQGQDEALKGSREWKRGAESIWGRREKDQQSRGREGGQVCWKGTWGSSPYKMMEGTASRHGVGGNEEKKDVLACGTQQCQWVELKRILRRNWNQPEIPLLS